MLLRILGAWCESSNKRILSYKDAVQRIKCESMETTVRTGRLLLSRALLRMGDHRLPKRVMLGGLRTRETVGRGGRRNNKRTAWQRIVGYFGSRRTGAPPYLTLGSGTAQCVKGAVGLWPRGRWMEEEKASERRQKKREAKDADKIEVVPGVTVASLRRFRAVMIGPTQRLHKRRRLCW